MTFNCNLCDLKISCWSDIILIAVFHFVKATALATTRVLFDLQRSNMCATVLFPLSIYPTICMISLCVFHYHHDKLFFFYVCCWNKCVTWIISLRLHLIEKMIQCHNCLPSTSYMPDILTIRKKIHLTQQAVIYRKTLVPKKYQFFS